MAVGIKIQLGHSAKDALDQLSKIFKNEEGRISWPSWELDQGTFALIYNLRFDRNVDDHLKDAGIWKAINECAKANNFSSKFFIRQLKLFVDEYQNKVPKSYRFVTQVNCNYSTRLPKILHSFDGDISFQSSLSKKIVLHTTTLINMLNLGLNFKTDLSSQLVS
jgi:hypothetical protein